MCQCNPNIRTPFCGNGDCVWPISGTSRPSDLDMLAERQPPMNPDGSQIWYAVSNPRAVRNQPMALFRLASDAQLIGRKMIAHDVEIVPVLITLPTDIDQPDQPMPPIVILSDAG